MYLIKGKPLEVTDYSAKIQVDDFEDICPITRTNVISYYTSNGEDKLDIVSYKASEAALLLNRAETIDEDGDKTYRWNSLDDEFAYRKFAETWKPIYKNVESIGDPLRFTEVSTVLNTGNKFITSMFLNGSSKDVQLFEYNRHLALLDIVYNCFKELNMEFKGDTSYSQTKNQKIWGNSTHSCIEYVTAFGSYIFTNTYKNTQTKITGKLEDLIKRYNEDKRNIESIIKLKYTEHFGSIDESKFNFSALLATLRTCLNTVSKIEYKSKSYSEYNSSKRLLNEAISLIENSYKV